MVWPVSKTSREEVEAVTVGAMVKEVVMGAMNRRHGQGTLGLTLRTLVTSPLSRLLLYQPRHLGNLGHLVALPKPQFSPIHQLVVDIRSSPPVHQLTKSRSWFLRLL